MVREIEIKPVTSVQQLEAHRDWLASFDHKIPTELTGRFHEFWKEKTLLAITQQMALNVLVPAVNPKAVAPRDTRRIVSVFHAWSANLPGGLSVAVPADSQMHAFMPKLGYRPKAVLYEAT